jgi:hypothetical protein
MRHDYACLKPTWTSVNFPHDTATVRDKLEFTIQILPKEI